MPNEETMMFNCTMNLGHIATVNKISDRAVDFYKMAYQIALSRFGEADGKTKKAFSCATSAAEKHRVKLQQEIKQAKMMGLGAK